MISGKSDFLKLSKKGVGADVFEFSDPKFLKRYTGIKGKIPKKRQDIVTNIFGNIAITEDNTKWNRLLDKVEHIQGRGFIGVDIGLFNPVPQKVIDYGVKNELGIERPQRSYIALTFDMNKKKMLRMLSETIKYYFFRETRSKNKLYETGKFLQSKIKQFMFGDYWLLRKPNKPETVRRKGFNHPLIDSKKLVNSIAIRKVTGKSNKK